MNQLSALQIDLIRGDIRQNGVELKDLEEDLLDHICCTIEAEGLGNKPFEQVYESVKKQICPDGYREIQEITAELITQKYNNMKRTMNTLGIIGSSILLIGSILKHLHLAPANEALALGGLTIILGYLPLLLILSLRQTDMTLGKFRNISGYVGANMIVIGVVFQVLHYPYGKELLLAGVLIFLLLFVPLFFRSVGKEALASVHPATLTVIVLAVASSFFAFSMRQPSNAYVQSLIAINNNIEESFDQKYSRAGEISSEAQDAIKYIDNLKQHLLNSVEPKNDELFRGNIFRFNESQKEIILGSSHDYNGQILQSKLSAYVDKIQTQKPGINTILEKTKNYDWLNSNFSHGPLYSIYTKLSNYQLEIVSLEMELTK